MSFYPFVSSLQKTYDGSSESDYSIGLDVKYGITENFTLDATLIPDFSQAGFDRVTLNLGPFEQTFSEQRQFFTEGVDLFNKGNLFFSRRVGSAPTGSVDLEDNEITKNLASEVKTLNATKVSGRTRKGLGIGFFNAITEKTDAVIQDTITGEIRKQVVEPLANYNILVIDQQFNRNSSVSLINTNVIRSGEFRDANVTGLLFDISNKSNKYNLSGEGKMSRLNLVEDDQIGYAARLSAAKIYGNYRARIGISMADRSYDINDLGLQFRNNFNNLFFNASYRIFEPTEKLNNFNVFVWGNYNRLFDPGTYTGNSLGLSINGQTKKLLWFGGNINTQIGKQYDYFEPRDTANNRFFIYENWLNANAWFETNNNKVLAVEGNAGFGTLFEDGRDLFNFWLGFEPTVRFNDNFRMNYDLYYQNNKGNRGFVTNNGNDIVFGERNQTSLTNSLSGSYNFNPLHALTLSFRNYWTTVTYDQDLFALMDNGRLDQEAGYNKDNIGFDPDINFMTWNLDLRYTWQFAPGSQLIALYRNQLFNQDAASEINYGNSLGNLFDQAVEHTFSLRLIYFLDYNNMKGWFKNKRNI
ncbi:MAG: protein with DOMON-like ligand-binding domain protein [Bacteroidia bacterium]|nr:protein with DOMON-like ligand-binding domain protein [Bacteroidia bacterium]